MEEAPKLVDWTHPPAGVEVRSLYGTLHDADLVACVSDRMARTVRLSFELFESDAACEIVLQEVTSARVTVSIPWPGECASTKGLTRAEESRVIAEYQAKWREESLGWDTFEAALAAGSLWTLDADLTVGPETRALRLSGTLERDAYEDRYTVITVAFTDLAITVDGEATTLEVFEKLAEVQNRPSAARDRRVV